MNKNHSQYKHGMGSTKDRNPFYTKWNGIKRRCLNPKEKCYGRYGGRGITICKRWLDFENFYKDMFESYTKHIDKYGREDTTIERIDNKKGYSPKNCTWVTRAEQQKNKSNVKLYNLNGVKLNASDWDRRLGLKQGTVRARIKIYKWPIEKALTTGKKTYTGFFIDNRGRYRVDVSVKGKKYFVGRFKTEEEARLAKLRFSP